MFRYYLLFVIACFHGSGDGPVAPTLTVCEALSQRSSLNGRMVQIRGVVEGATEGAWLRGDCSFGIETKRHKWRTAIALTDPRSRDVLHRVDFRADEQQQQRVARQIESASLGAGDRVWLTYEGVFETYPTLEDRVHLRPDGTTITMGFGHMGFAPAQLVIRHVKELTIERRGTPAK